MTTLARDLYMLPPETAINRRVLRDLDAMAVRSLAVQDLVTRSACALAVSQFYLCIGETGRAARLIGECIGEGPETLYPSQVTSRKWTELGSGDPSPWDLHQGQLAIQKSRVLLTQGETDRAIDTAIEYRAILTTKPLSEEAIDLLDLLWTALATRRTGMAFKHVVINWEAGDKLSWEIDESLPGSLHDVYYYMRKIWWLFGQDDREDAESMLLAFAPSLDMADAWPGLVIRARGAKALLAATHGRRSEVWSALSDGEQVAMQTADILVRKFYYLIRKEAIIMLNQGDEASKATDDFLRNENEPKTQPGSGPEMADESPRPWRGIFSPEVEPTREVLFTKNVEFRTADLPPWAPHITINPRWADDGDD